MEADYRGYRVDEPQSAYAVPQPRYLSVDEYLEFEETSPVRHEYINGAVHAMTGASLAHVRISQKLIIALSSHLRGGSCEAFMADVKLNLKLDTDEIFYYPDVVVACRREDWGKNYVRNPTLVVEVLSPSTQHIDRREKALNYRRTNSIEEYVLIAQDEHQVTIHRRAESWRPKLLTGREAIAEFRSIGLSLPLGQIYEGTLTM
jgi:Uma2 family endonuclease